MFVHNNCLTLPAGGQGVSGAEGSVFCWFPCTPAPLALYWCWCHWDRVLLDGACEGKCLLLRPVWSQCDLICVPLNYLCLLADIHWLHVPNWYLDFIHLPFSVICRLWWDYMYTQFIQFIHPCWAGPDIQGSPSQWSQCCRKNSSICGCNRKSGKTAFPRPGIPEPRRVWKRFKLLPETSKIK